MTISYDPAKREWTLHERGLNFDDAGKVFDGPTFTLEDDRQDYGEIRYQTLGKLHRQTVMVVWTPDGEGRRIISMRKATKNERTYYQLYARSG